MARDSVHRRLSAVLVADVVGYSRLMEADEIGTLAALNACRSNVIEPAVSEHQGRIVKVMGDGFLIEFGSVVDAVQCALDVQSGMEKYNSKRSDQRKMMLRIGINLGDVIVEREDLYGDGINIAARLQAMAEPGSVLLSGTVYDHLKSKIPIGFEFLGDQRVKNIAEPIRIYRVLTDKKDAGKTVTRAGRVPSSWGRRSFVRALAVLVLAISIASMLALRNESQDVSLTLPDKPSIAILPFDNIGADPEQDYFAAGVTDGLITDLSQVSGLFIISRNSSFAYKDKEADVRQIAKELGVRYVLEGSVQRSGDQLRINAQLIDSVTGGDVWADRYDGSLSDVFLFQDKVTRSITDALALRLTSEEQSALAQQQTKVPAAYDAFLRGWEHFRRATPQDYDKAIPYFEKAVELDSSYGRAYAALALVHHAKGASAWNLSVGYMTTDTLSTIEKYLREAEKNPTSTSHQVRGLVATGYALFPQAIAEFKEAIASDPSDSWSYAYMAWSLTFAGRPEEAMQYIRTAMRLDPHFPPIFLSFLGFAQFNLGQYEGAAKSLEQSTKSNPDDTAGMLLLAATYGYLGRREDAAPLIAAYNASVNRLGNPPISATFAWNTWYYLRRSDRDRLFQGLVLAGVPEKLH